MNLGKNKRCLMRYAIRHKLPDEVLVGIARGGQTKASVYGMVIGKHPTKKGRYYAEHSA